MRITGACVLEEGVITATMKRVMRIWISRCISVMMLACTCGAETVRRHEHTRAEGVPRQTLVASLNLFPFQLPQSDSLIKYKLIKALVRVPNVENLIICHLEAILRDSLQVSNWNLDCLLHHNSKELALSRANLYGLQPLGYAPALWQRMRPAGPVRPSHPHRNSAGESARNPENKACARWRIVT